MKIQDQIEHYIDSQPEPKRSDIRALDSLVKRVIPGCRLWFDDGKNEANKTVTNPTIGYGQFTIKYKDGKTKDFFQVGISGNSTGVSVYILGIKDKSYLAKQYGAKLGKAKVTGYCIRFRSLKDIDTEILEDAIRLGIVDSLRD